jgi:transcription elongation factor Elf1
MSRQWTTGEYEEYHESRESLMDDGQEKPVIVDCAGCGEPINEEDGHTHDSVDGYLCDDCYDTVNEAEAEEDAENEDGEPDEPEEA